MWPFSRNKEQVSKGEFEKLIESIGKSFINVKKDVSSINNRTEKNEDLVKTLRFTIEQMNESLKMFHSKLNSLEFETKKSYHEVQPSIFEEETVENFTKENIQRVWNDLTTVQRSLVIRLKQLQDESGQEFISMKTIARELYPETEYHDVKAMISNYTDLLFEQGFIEKKRRRRESFVSITKRSLPFVPKKEVILKKKQKNL